MYVTCMHQCTSLETLTSRQPLCGAAPAAINVIGIKFITAIVSEDRRQRQNRIYMRAIDGTCAKCTVRMLIAKGL